MTNLELVFESIKIAAIIVGGGVALYEYKRFRRYGAKAQLDIDFHILPIGKTPGDYLLDIRPTIKNLGSIRQKFPIIEIWVKTITDHDITNVRANKKRMRFSKIIASISNIVPKPEDPYFIDPGVTQEFPVQVKIENPNEFIQVAVRFFYQVSCITYLRLYFVYLFKLSKKWKNPKKIKRLKIYKVDQYHIASKTKRLAETKDIKG